MLVNIGPDHKDGLDGILVKLVTDTVAKKVIMLKSKNQYVPVSIPFELPALATICECESYMRE